MDPRSVRSLFRIVAFAEAVSWAGLLIAMFFKWVVQDDSSAGMQGGVPIMGPIHGAVFVLFVAMCFVAWKTFAWNVKTLLVALVSAVPPFTTVVFEVVADKRGLLQTPAVEPHEAATAS